MHWDYGVPDTVVRVSEILSVLPSELLAEAEVSWRC